jgi:hypothetical protein
MTPDDKKYLMLLRSSCIAAIKQLEINYLAFKVIFDGGYIYHLGNLNIDAAYLLLYNAKVFLKEHPTNMVSDFLDASDYDKVLEECNELSNELGRFFNFFVCEEFIPPFKKEIEWTMRYQQNPIPTAINVPFSGPPVWYAPSGLNRKYPTIISTT